MSNYKVSIGIPVYNASKYIERCARSIFEQSYDNLQIVFVDDFSTDNSVEIINQVLQDYPQRKSQTSIIKQERNKGVSEARNTAIDNFEGIFLFFVDADDYLLKNAITLLVDKQIKTGADMVTGFFKYEVSDQESYCIMEPEYSCVSEMVRNIVSQPGRHEVFNRLVRRKTIVNNNIRFAHDLSMGEDWLFLVECTLYIKSISLVKEITYFYNGLNQMSAMHNIRPDNYRHRHFLADATVLARIKELIYNGYPQYLKNVDIMLYERITIGLEDSIKAGDRLTFEAFKKYITPQIRKLCLAPTSYVWKYALLGKPVYDICRAYVWHRKIRDKIKACIAVRSNMLNV